MTDNKIIISRTRTIHAIVTETSSIKVERSTWEMLLLEHGNNREAAYADLTHYGFEFYEVDVQDEVAVHSVEVVAV